MTVAELIAELQTMPPNAIVIMSRDAELNALSPLDQYCLTIRGTLAIDRLGKKEKITATKPIIILLPR